MIFHKIDYVPIIFWIAGIYIDVDQSNKAVSYKYYVPIIIMYPNIETIIILFISFIFIFIYLFIL